MHGEIAGFIMPSEQDVRRAAESLRLLADPTRIKILWALLQGETSVACLADLVRAPSAGVSQHLSKLRLAGLVESRREGSFVFYSAAGPWIRAVLEEALQQPVLAT